MRGLFQSPHRARECNKPFLLRVFKHLAYMLKQMQAIGLRYGLMLAHHILIYQVEQKEARVHLLQLALQWNQ